MNKFCDYCKGEILSQKKKKFCNNLCQARHYNRRPEIREKNRIRMKEYRKDNLKWREKHRLTQAKYAEKRKLYRRVYYSRPEVRIKLRDKARNLRKNNVEYAIAGRLRESLRHALTNYTITGKIMSSKKYGLNWKEIITKLQPFPHNIKEYEIDHIIPLRTFNLANLEDVKRAFSPENLQWLTKAENRKKGGRITNLN